MGTKCPQSKRPTSRSHPIQILHLHGPQTKKADLRPARVLALVPFFFLVSCPSPRFPHCVPPLGVANYDLGKNAQPRRGGRKTKLGRANGVTTGTRPTLQSRHPVPTGSYSHPAVKTTVQRSYQRGVGLQAVRSMGLGLKGFVRIRMPFWFWTILSRSGVESCLPGDVRDPGKTQG